MKVWTTEPKRSGDILVSQTIYVAMPCQKWLFKQRTMKDAQMSTGVSETRKVVGRKHISICCGPLSRNMCSGIEWKRHRFSGH